MTDEDQAIIANLAKLGPLEYDRARRQAARELGCRVSVLDTMVEEARANDRLAAIMRRVPAWQSSPSGDPGRR